MCAGACYDAREMITLYFYICDRNKNSGYMIGWFAFAKIQSCVRSVIDNCSFENLCFINFN